MTPLHLVVPIAAAMLSAASTAALAADPIAPTAFEAFAAQPNARVVSSKEMGSIVSSDAKMKLFALVVEVEKDAASRMKGVRLDLEDNSAYDHVYLDETQLASTRREMALMKMGMEMAVDLGDAPYRVQGTATCWMPRTPLRILCPHYRTGVDGPALGMSAYGGTVFSFPDCQPVELADLLDLAIAELKQR